MAKISLGRGYVALVDDIDCEWLSQWNWTAQVCKGGGVYAVSCRRIEGKNQTFFMHREILGRVISGPFKHTDHINGNALDNRRENLRAADPWQNALNRKSANKNNKASKYRNIGFNSKASRHPWLFRIRVNGKVFRRGGFATETEAVEAFNQFGPVISGGFAPIKL